MPIPLIAAAVVAAGAAAGGGGLVLGGRGGLAIKRAQKRIDEAAAKYDRRRVETDAQIETINQQLEDYGLQQASAVDSVVKRMVKFMIRNQKSIKENEVLLVDGMDAAAAQIVGADGVVLSSLMGVAGGALGGAAAGVGAGAAASALATTIGAASTGAAISGLSGAAASNATLAWLGGGALSAGGGGMAAGAVVLNSVVVGPAVLIAGFTVGKQGAKATTKAQKAEADVDIAIAELDLFDSALEAVEERCRELSSILDDLVERAVAALDELESEPFEPLIHAGRFQRAFVLTKAVRDVVATAVLDEEGVVTSASHAIVVRFQEPESGSESAAQVAAESGGKDLNV